MLANHKTLTMESHVIKSFNYLSRMVDADNVPYFNIFWAEPSQAAHDWPDHGDVQTRQLQALVMARRMTGERLPVEQIWYDHVMSMLDSGSGFLRRPEKPFNLREFGVVGDQALTLYALVTAYVDNRDEALGDAIRAMVDGLIEVAPTEAGGLETFGFHVKSLMVAARYLGYEPALKFAGQVVEKLFSDSSTLFTVDDKYTPHAHGHGTLRTLVGAADYALHTGDKALLERINRLYLFAKAGSTSFGFVPEAFWRDCDIVLCETCTIMDYLGIAVTLANHGHPEYWDHVEKAARNHLIENQVTDGSWLGADPGLEDTEQFTWHDLSERVVGGYAGWSSPNHILAAREALDRHWGGPELHGKTRALQGCCGGSGTHAFFIVWKNSARYDDGVLSINVHFDKLMPQAEIRCHQPYKGLLTIDMKEQCRVKVRVPSFTTPEEMSVTVNGSPVQCGTAGIYLDLGERSPGDKISVNYPLPVTVEEFSIGNPGHRQYNYRATWKGDTVVKMEPLGNEYKTAYSDFDNKEVPVFYGTEGPGPLYQREHMLQDTEPELSPVCLDDGFGDFWMIP